MYRTVKTTDRQAASSGIAGFPPFQFASYFSHHNASRCGFNSRAHISLVPGQNEPIEISDDNLPEIQGTEASGQRARSTEDTGTDDYGLWSNSSRWWWYASSGLFLFNFLTAKKTFVVRDVCLVFIFSKKKKKKKVHRRQWILYCINKNISKFSCQYAVIISDEMKIFLLLFWKEKKHIATWFHLPKQAKSVHTTKCFVHL